MKFNNKQHIYISLILLFTYTSLISISFSNNTANLKDEIKLDEKENKEVGKAIKEGEKEILKNESSIASVDTKIKENKDSKNTSNTDDKGKLSFKQKQLDNNNSVYDSTNNSDETFIVKGNDFLGNSNVSILSYYIIHLVLF